jgi:hypothetical protein
MNTDILMLLLKITLVIIMVGNLLDMGLRLKMGDALKGIKNLKADSLQVTTKLLKGNRLWTR